MNSSTTRAAPQSTARDRWMHRVMNDPRTKRHHATAARRRRLVVGHLLATALLFGGLVALVATDVGWWGLGALVVLVVWMPLTGMLNSMTYGLFELRGRMLDERQLAERAAVQSLTYRSLRYVLVALVFCAVGANWGGVRPTEHPSLLGAVGSGVLVLYFLLPLWLAGLRAPDQVEDELPELRER